MHYEYLLGRLLSSRRYADYKLLKQIYDYQNQKIKAENAANKLALFRLEPWMPSASVNIFGGRLLDKIRNQTARTALALFTVFLFCLPVYAENVTGKVVENGSSYGVLSAKVEIYINGNASPTTTFTDLQGNFSTSVVGIEEFQNTKVLNFEITAGPNPGSTQTVKWSNHKSADTKVVVYDIATGEQIKTLYSGLLEAGTYKINWDGTNDNNQRVSDGRYAIQITAGKEHRIVKTILNQRSPMSIGIEYAFPKREAADLNKSTETWQPDSVRLSGQNIETKTLKGFGTQNGDLELGSIPVEGTNIVTGYAYDLWTKYLNRTGIPNLEVRIKSIPEKTVLTDTNGIFVYKTTRTGADSLIILSPEFYNWKHPININSLTEVKAFNDSTGIPLIKQYFDPENGEDLMEFLQRITEVAIHHYTNHPEFDYTVPRFNNEIVFVYLNRQNAPIGYYPDSSFAGMKALENEKLTFIETLDSAEATIHMIYNNINVGNGENMRTAFDENNQPYIQNWDINLRGPPSPFLLEPYYVAPVVAHELEHAIFFSGEHSPYSKDLISISPLSYYDLGYPTRGSEKEILARKILSHLERNPKLLEFYK
jgi:hypothetical protein